MRLVERLNNEMLNFAKSGLKVYSRVSDLELDNKADLDKLKNQYEVIQRIVSNGTSQSDYSFTIKNLKSLNGQYNSLLSVFNTTSKGNMLEVLLENSQKYYRQDFKSKVNEMNDFNMAIGFLSSFSTFAFDMPLATVGYGLGALTAFATKFVNDKKQYLDVLVPFSFLGGLGLGLYSLDDFEKLCNPVLPSFFLISTGLALRESFLYSKNIFYSNRNNKILSNISEFHSTFNKMLKTGIIVSEAYKGLQKIQKLKKKNVILLDDVELEYEKFLLSYLDSEVSIENLINYKFTKDVSTKSEVVDESCSSKLVRIFERDMEGISSFLQSNKKKRKAREDAVETEDCREDRVDKGFQFVLSKTLKNKTDINLSGFPIQRLIDYSVSKISGNKGRTSFIRNDRKKKGLERLLQSNNLPSDAPIFKMQPLGSLRTLYALVDQKVVLIDIMSHEEYDKLIL